VSETFEEWCSRYCNNETSDNINIISGVLKIITRDCWNHQQKKLEEQALRLDELEKIINGYSDKGFWGRTALRLKDENKRLEKKLAERDKEISDYLNGWLGCCHTCEPVAIKNQWQNEVIHRLVEKLDFVLNRFDTLLGGEVGMTHIRKFCDEIKKHLEEKEK